MTHGSFSQLSVLGPCHPETFLGTDCGERDPLAIRRARKTALRRLSRAKMTPEQLNVRRKKDREAKARKRMSQTPAQREEAKKKQRESKKRAREAVKAKKIRVAEEIENNVEGTIWSKRAPESYARVKMENEACAYVGESALGEVVGSSHQDCAAAVDMSSSPVTSQRPPFMGNSYSLLPESIHQAGSALAVDMTASMHGRVGYVSHVSPGDEKLVSLFADASPEALYGNQIEGDAFEILACPSLSPVFDPTSVVANEVSPGINSVMTKLASVETHGSNNSEEVENVLAGSVSTQAGLLTKNHDLQKIATEIKHGISSHKKVEYGNSYMASHDGHEDALPHREVSRNEDFGAYIMSGGAYHSNNIPGPRLTELVGSSRHGYDFEHISDYLWPENARQAHSSASEMREVSMKQESQILFGPNSIHFTDLFGNPTLISNRDPL